MDKLPRLDNRLPRLGEPERFSDRVTWILEVDVRAVAEAIRAYQERSIRE